MKISSEIQRLKYECSNKITREQMCHSFGEDFETRLIKHDHLHGSFELLFEEDGALYLQDVEYFRSFYLFNGSTREVSDYDLSRFIRKRKDYETQIQLFDEVSEHPKYRLKMLFE
jgi:hypothetical protein